MSHFHITLEAVPLSLKSANAEIGMGVDLQTLEDYRPIEFLKPSPIWTRDAPKYARGVPWEPIFLQKLSYVK